MSECLILEFRKKINDLINNSSDQYNGKGTNLHLLLGKIIFLFSNHTTLYLSHTQLVINFILLVIRTVHPMANNLNSSCNNSEGKLESGGGGGGGGGCSR